MVRESVKPAIQSVNEALTAESESDGILVLSSAACRIAFKNVEFSYSKDAAFGLRGRQTILSIPHRLSTVMEYDRALVLRDGVITESDAPGKLMRREGGVFRQMCIRQRLVHGKE